MHHAPNSLSGYCFLSLSGYTAYAEPWAAYSSYQEKTFALWLEVHLTFPEFQESFSDAFFA
jgi:hypothetical protein